MDPLRLAIAVVPLAAYLSVIGLVNLRKRPLVVGGYSDSAALAAALGGLIVVGPMELFMPMLPALRYGAYVWYLLLALSALCAALLILAMRPRLVIYNMTLEALRPALATVVSQLDTNARWTGHCVLLPALGVELHLETTGVLHNVALVATGYEQNLAGWQQLDAALRKALADAAVPRGARGVIFLACAAALMVAALSQMILDPQAVALAIHEMLHP
jgi:hypothetical protein